MDMHSGGACKQEPHEYIYIELPYEAANAAFQARFGHDPNEVACSCCGANYSIDEEPTLEAACAYDRDCEWDDVNNEYDVSTGQPVAEYEKRSDVFILRATKL